MSVGKLLKAIILILVLVSVLILTVRLSGQLIESVLGIKQRAGISILSNPSSAKVILDGADVGQTPYENKDLESKEYTLRVEKDQNFWSGKVKLTAGTVTVVDRELGQDNFSSAGEVLTLSKGKGLAVISSPDQGEVEVDGKVLGKTPILVSDLKAGEHLISISHPNYLKRSLKANLPEGFSLTIYSDLAISSVDLTTFQAPVATSPAQVSIKETPTGFLRVRDKPNLKGLEIARVKPGDKLILLQEVEGWMRVKMPNGVEGYVSALYVEKITP